MLRTLIVALAIVLGVHHAAMTAAGPAHAGPTGACESCATHGGQTDHGDAGMAGMLMAACLAVAAVASRVPSLRRRVLAVLRFLLPGPVPGRVARRLSGVLRAPPPPPSGLVVRRC